MRELYFSQPYIFSDDGNCNKLRVTGSNYLACTGIYSLTDEKASKSQNYSVYQMVNATSGKLCNLELSMSSYPNLISILSGIKFLNFI